MSKYEYAKAGHLCPFCEKSAATEVEEKEWDKRWLACGKNDEDPGLNAWENQFCWAGWSEPGECRNGMSIEDRLVEVLEQRDATRQELAKCREVI